MAAAAADSNRTFLARYREAVAREGFVRDKAQADVAARLDALGDELAKAGPARRGGLLGRLRGARPPVTGLYLWGGVGRGKTWLVDLFFEGLPFADRQRLHFHRLMLHVHAELKRRPGADPLPAIARDYAKRARLLCLDEFFVADIADAMILGGFLRALFAEGVTVVATSNVAPDDLYRGGLQRQRFLPTIDRIKQHMDVVHLHTATDYRLRALERAELYHAPLDDAAEASLAASFRGIAPERGEADVTLEVNGRELRTVRHADGVAWFTFDELCRGARAAADYVELAREHHTLLVSGVPVMDDDDNNAARRFIALVDECYDRNVKLVISAAAQPDALYRGKRLAFEFDRTRSRFTEMQSHDYLGREHKP